MSYATVADFVDAFGERESRMLADRDQDGSYEPAVITRALDAASLQIDGAVSQRCSLPLAADTSAAVMGMLKQWCLDIARYRLAGSSGVQVTDDIEARYRDAKQDLDKVVAGKIAICKVGGDAAAGGLSQNDGSSGAAQWDALDRRLHASQLTGFFGGL